MADASKFVAVFNFTVLCEEGNTFSSTVSGSDPARAHKRQPKEKIPFSPQRLRGTELKNKVIRYH